jgi:DNA repair protein RecN (Recombination protein N)
MLRELTIKNVAVIDALTVSFVPGLNILTGETGAGKSILIDALQLVLGARSSEELLRTRADEAVVEAAFDLPVDAAARTTLDAEGIAIEPGEFLILRRHLLRDGKSKAYVGGRLTSAATLRALAESLVDIHGQHPGQPLLDPRRHREFVDAYAGTLADVIAYREHYDRWQALRRERDELVAAERERTRRTELLEFQRRELEVARLESGEEEALAAERAILVHHERLFSAVEQAYVDVEESDDAVLTRLGGAATRLRDAAAIDPRLQEVLEALEAAMVQLGEAARGLRDYRGRIEFDPQRLEAIEARLHELGRLKRKYGGSVDDLLGQLAGARRALDALERSEARLQETEHALAAVRVDLSNRAGRLTAARTGAARALQQTVRDELAQLGMAKAVFEVRVTAASADEAALGPHGADSVEFLISPNPGESVKPLHKIASGGELSRVMLAIRTILASADQTPTVIFDEVDAGIGGSMGEVVGRKLFAASTRHQVLCVTHLPQIACFGDQHLVVRKRNLADHTETTARVLGDDDRAREVARMLGGPSRSGTALDHANELLGAASRLKKRMKGATGRGDEPKGTPNRAGATQTEYRERR